MENNINLAEVRKGAWTPEEDSLLRKCIENYGEGKWHLVPLRAGLNRCRKSCRMRWLNYLSPNIKRGQFTKDEVDLIIRLHKLLGNRWTLIAGRLPGRTANDVKNFWKSHIDKKLLPSAAGETARPDKAQKTITSSNILRPRPWTFSNLLINCPRETVRSETTQQKIDEINPNNKQQYPSSLASSSSSHKADECIRWWTNFLVTSTENYGLVADEEHKKGHSLQKILAGSNDKDNATPQEEGDFCMDLDVWELLNSGDEREIVRVGDRIKNYEVHETSKA